MQPLKDFFYVHHKRGDYDIVYEIAESYDQGISGFTGDYEYWAYLNNAGGWVIQRHQISNGQYRYYIGESDLATSWALRASLTPYIAYDKLFLSKV
jgi:hypothetical protein